MAPICLPETQNVYRYEDGETKVVVGWGRLWETAPAPCKISQKLNVPVLNLKDCAQYTIPAQRRLSAGYIRRRQGCL